MRMVPPNHPAEFSDAEYLAALLGDDRMLEKWAAIFGWEIISSRDGNKIVFNDPDIEADLVEELGPEPITREDLIWVLSDCDSAARINFERLAN